jgi:hypothetical protein
MFGVVMFVFGIIFFGDLSLSKAMKMKNKSNKFIQSKIIAATFIGFIIFVLCLPDFASAKYLQLDAVIGVKSRFSSGCSSIQELANLAQHRKIDVVFFSDNDRLSLEYGVDPFERIFKKKRVSASVLTSGAAPYLSEISSNDKNFPETLLIPALETAPFYFWTGNVIDKNLIAHNWSKRLLLVGMNNSAAMEQIPSLNSNFSQRYLENYLPQFLIWIGLFLLFLILYFKSKRRICFFFVVIFLLLALNDHPFQSSMFNQYDGDQGIAPYQELIDYASANNALTFWVRPEFPDNPGVKDSVGIKTEPFTKDLLSSEGYTGFEAVYDGGMEVVKPGKEWDQVLTQHISGKRKKPIWAYGGNDLVCEGEQGRRLGGVRTILLVREKTQEAALEAIAKGRMYAVAQPTDFRLSLDEFTVFDRFIGQYAEQGDVLFSTDVPVIKAKLRFSSGGHERAKVSLIREGKLIKRENVTLPYQLNWSDSTVKPKGMTYYRLIAEISPDNRLVSNPIFVNFSESAMQAASLSSEKITKAKMPKESIEPVKLQEPKIQNPQIETPKSPELETPEIPEIQNIQGKIGIPEEPVVEVPKLLGTEPPKEPEVVSEIKPIPDLEANFQTKPPELIKSGQENISLESTKNVDTKSVNEEPKMPIPIEESKTMGIPEEKRNEEDKKVSTEVMAKLDKPKSPIATPEIKASSVPESLKAPQQNANNEPKVVSTSNNRYVISLIDGLTLKSGPSVKFPEVATAKKGERLLFVRKMDKSFNGKPWLEIKKGNQRYFVWGGLVKLE